MAICVNNLIMAQFAIFNFLSGNGAAFIFLALPRICPVSVVSILKLKIRHDYLLKKKVVKYKISSFKSKQTYYSGFPVPFNECIYQLLNEY